jgi:hypothetical protein
MAEALAGGPDQAAEGVSWGGPAELKGMVLLGKGAVDVHSDTHDLIIHLFSCYASTCLFS